MAPGRGSLDQAAGGASLLWRAVGHNRQALCRVARGAVGLSRSGLIGPYRPDHLAAMGQAVRHRGINLGILGELGSARGQGRMALIDDQGPLSYAELDDCSDAVALCLSEGGVGPDHPVGLLCRNGRGFVIALVALGKLGADTVHLNTGFATPQLRQAMAREGIRTIIVDKDLLSLLDPRRGSPASSDPRGPRVVVADGGATDPRSFAAMMGARPWGSVGRPARIGRQIVLTSGTTGEPKGAQRALGADVAPLVSLLSAIPLRSRDTVVMAAPMFHSWGLANAVVGLLLGMRLVVSARFDPEQTLAAVERHGARVLIAVPVMLQRIMELPAAVRARYDLSSLQVVALSGSAIPVGLAARFMEAYGPVVYNLYGSTEIGWASIASPSDLIAAPTCAGRVPPGTTVRILDDQGVEEQAGRSGRIFVRSALLFEGYTGGGGKKTVDGFMATGDIGHFVGARLFVDGRDDEMIVSGGENVFPREVEDLLASQPGVAEVSVIGVDDVRFGQRLHAFVVRRSDISPPADEASLLAEVAANLARYKVPRGITFIDQLPRNSTGKVLTRELRHLLEAPPPRRSRARPAGRR